MTQADQNQADYATAHFVAAGEDRHGEQRGLGISSIHFKVTTRDTNDILIIENNFQESGGPARHLHYNQQERFRLNPGDSLLAPRKVPHVWAFAGGARGRILIAFMPAGKTESFFREVTKADAMPPQDPALWHAHDMALLGPPLSVM